MRNYYEILGVDKKATTEEIRSRYIFLVKVYHPDRFTDPDSKTRAENDLKEINLAYGVLSNQKKRQEYDNQINSAEYNDVRESTDQQEDESAQEQFSLLINYLQEVTERWNHIIDPLPDISSTKVPFDALGQIVVGLVFMLLPDKSSSQKDGLIEEIAQDITSVISINIMLGAEYEQNGYRPNIDPVLLQYFTFYHVNQHLQDLLTKGLLEHRITESFSTQFIKDVTNNISLICRLSEGIGRRIVKKQEQSNSTDKKAGFSEKSEQQEKQSTYEAEEKIDATGYCQSCFANAPTEKVSFSQNIGAIVVRFTKKVEGELCADCIEKNFWEMTGITLLFGWFGIISFITTPFILIENLANYLSANRVRKYSSNLSSIAIGWKFIIALTLIVITYVGFSLGSSSTTKARTQQLPTQTQVRNITAPTRTPSPTKRPTQVSVVYKSPTPENKCILWSKVTSSDKGKKLCVYGTVRKAYWGEDIFFMTFGDGINDFRMLVLNGYYYEDIQGKCVKVEGEVKTYQNLPYIEVNDNLLKCP
jgi:curved DNA-binding protein CbpA